jgi:acetyl esterase/lipase
MAFEMDPEYLTHMMAKASAPLPEFPPGPVDRDDWLGLRNFSNTAVTYLDGSLPEHAAVTRTDFKIPSYDTAEVLVRWYSPPGHDPEAAGPAVIYLHGGGMIAGSVALYDRYVASYVVDSGVPMLSVDYRLAPEHPHPTPVEDCYAALKWLTSHASALGVDSSRVAIMGDSGGGGLAAATTLIARDRGQSPTKQILIYPMLDDRTTTPDPALVPFASWTYENNYTGWHALLGDVIGTSDVPAAAAPARATDLTDLPRAYIEVGELDIFRDESIEYAQRLAAAGISTELHVHPGCVHGFDRGGLEIDVARRAWSDRLRVLRAL